MEKNLLSDALASQKFSTASYNTWAGECDNPQLRSTMMNLLKDEHDIQNCIFTIMKHNNMYPLKQADQQMITEAKNQVTASQGQN